MCKANDNMVSKVAELMELKQMIEELENEHAPNTIPLIAIIPEYIIQSNYLSPQRSKRSSKHW